MGAFIGARPSADSGPGPAVAVDGGKFAESHPALWEHLTIRTWEGGTQRTTSTILVFLDPDGLKACLSDRDGGKVAFVTAADVPGLWRALEKGLVAGTLEWRVSRSAPTGKRK